MTDEHQIQQTMARYCWLVDHGGWEEWQGLFTDDASWQSKGADAFTGREALKRLAADLSGRVSAAPSRHVLSNVLVEVTGETAKLSSYLLLVMLATNTIALVGEYQVDFIKQGGAWRIKKLEFEALRQG
jgi:hypothetical protein